MAKRIKWSDEEYRKVFNGIKEGLAQRNVKIPLKQTKQLIELAVAAQLLLDPGRRRKLFNLDSIAPLLGQLKNAGIIPDEWSASPTRKTEKKMSADQIRINQLADERDAALNLATELQEKYNTLRVEVEDLRRKLASVPTEAQVVKGFVADILWSVEERKRALPGPTAKEIDQVVARPKHNSEPTQDLRERKPRVVVFYNENERNPDWSKDFPSLDIRMEPVRADGRVYVPQGAIEALLIHGVRHATTGQVREVYPGARLVMRNDVPKMLSHIVERLKGAVKI